MVNKSPRYMLCTLSRALEILSCFSGQSPEWGVTELAGYLGMNKSTVHRILITLESQGAIERHPNRRYGLGVRLFELGNAYRLQADVNGLAEPVMKRLAARVRLVVRLGKIEAGKAYDLARVDSPEPLHLYVNPMVGREATCSAVGKIFLAEKTGEQVTVFVKKYGLRARTPRSIVNLDGLTAELAKVREQGYALNNQEFVMWLRSIAAPVYDDLGQLAAALSVSGTLPEIPTKRIPVLAAEVRKAAEEISQALGWGLPTG